MHRMKCHKIGKLVMIKFMNLECMGEKEAAARYGYSVKWFQLMRRKESGPPYYQLKKKGKVFYAIDEVDEWFRKMTRDKE